MNRLHKVVGVTHLSLPSRQIWRSVGIDVELQASFHEAYLPGRSDSWTGQAWTEGLIEFHFIHYILLFSLFLSQVGNQRR